MTYTNYLSGILLTISLLSCTSKPKADLLVYNTTIYTIDSSFGKAEAMAIKDGKIIATGKSDSLLELFETTEKLNAQGQFIYPGFIDAHCHFLAYGKGLQECDLSGTTSWQDVLKRLADFATGTDSTKWLIGRGWDQNDWENKEFPTNERLTAMFPNRPVSLQRIDGHAIIINQKAIALAGIQPGQTLTGGEIVTQSGKLTGVLIDNATDLADMKMPASTGADQEKYLHDAEQKCFAVGLTSVQDCGLNFEQVQLVEKLYQEGKLSMRMYIMLSDKKENYEYLFAKGKIQTDQLTVNGFKLYADGALGSRGACLLQPYSDQPGHFGFLLKTKAYYDSIIPIIAEKGFQACTHAIGDSANRMMLNIYTKALKGKPGLRWRIEHAQVINENDFDLFGASQIIPSVQPTHATSDMYWADARLGPERLKSAYAYKRLLQQNGWMPLGTDFPVEDISPFKTFLAAVVRKDAKGFPDKGFQMENALTREETLRGMTIWAAKAAFEEQLKGSLEKGKLADFIILDKDLLTCDEKQILDVKVVKTFVGGKKVYQNN
ncbi:MAG: amidohydrolase [Chitinophagaceae bacterium]